MNDETPRTPGAAAAAGETPPQHYWSMEHHSYRPPDPAPSPPPAPGARRGSHGTGHRLAAAAVLAVALVVGAGSFAVAQSSDTTGPTTVQVGQIDHVGDRGGRGGPPGSGR